MQGTLWGYESCSPNQKISFVSIRLADLTMNFSAGQGKHMLGYALLSCWITGYCLWLEDCVTTRKVFWHGWSTLVERSRHDGQAEIWLNWSKLHFAPHPTRQVWLVKKSRLRFLQGPALPPYREEKISCLCRKLGMVQVKLWDKARSKPHVMVWCALCQEWPVSHTALRKAPGPCEIQTPMKHHLLLVEDQTVRTWQWLGKVTQLL